MTITLGRIEELRELASFHGRVSVPRADLVRRLRAMRMSQADEAADAIEAMDANLDVIARRLLDQEARLVQFEHEKNMKEEKY